MRASLLFLSIGIGAVVVPASARQVVTVEPYRIAPMAITLDHLRSRVAMEIDAARMAPLAIATAEMEANLAAQLLPLRSLAMHAAQLDAARSIMRVNLEPVTVALAPLAKLTTVSPDFDDTPLPPAASVQGDPADSLYRAARDAMNAGRYREAAELFRSIPSRFPKSSYVNEAYYWEAVSLQRQGGSSNLRMAVDRLNRQQQVLTQQMKTASTARLRQQLNDSRSLEARIKGQLASAGDAAAAEDVARIADAAASASASASAAPSVSVTVPSTTVIVKSPRPPRAPRPPKPPRGHWDSHECDGDDDGVQIQALNAVLQMNSERAVPILEKVMQRRDSSSVCLRRRAVFLLAQHSGPQTTSTLLSIVRNDPDKEVRENAVFWLSQVNDERAVSALDSIVRSNADQEVKEKALFALSQQSSPKANDALRAFALQESAPDELREKAIFWLGQRGSESGNSAFLRELYGKVTNAELKERIMFGIAQSNDAGARTWLLGIAKSPREPVENRKRALFWLGQSGDAISSADLAQLYREMEDREMREQLLFVLSQRSDRPAVDQLITIAKTDKDPELRKRAIFWLGQNSDPRAAQAIEQILTGER